MEPASGRLAPVTLCPVLHSSTEQVCSVFCVAAPSCEKTPLCLPAPSPRPSTPGALDSRPVCSSALAGPAGHSRLRPGPRVPGSALTALCRRPMLLPDVRPSCRRCLSGRRAEREERDSRAAAFPFARAAPSSRRPAPGPPAPCETWPLPSAPPGAPVQSSPGLRQAPSQVAGTEKCVPILRGRGFR